MKARIVGTGSAYPQGRLTNHDLEQIVDTSDEWIVTRTGIAERRRAHAGESTSTFAIGAVERALEMAGTAASELDLLLCATVTPDMPFPATACLVQEAIGARQATAFDFSAGCSGFVYGLEIASQFIENGRAKKVALVGSEVLTKFVDWNDRATCVLFGDGAGAVVLEGADNGHGLLGSELRSDGALADLIYLPGGGTKHPPSKEMYESGLAFIKMKGNETFKIAVRSLAEISDRVLEQSGIAHEEIRWFIPHQANQRIIDAVGQRLRIPAGRTYVNISRYGNTSAASIPIALDELVRDGKVAEGDLILVTAFGAGLTWGSAVLRW